MLSNVTQAAHKGRRRVDDAAAVYQQMREGHNKRRLSLQAAAELESLRVSTYDWLVAFLLGALEAAKRGETRASSYAIAVDFDIIKRELDAWGVVSVDGTHVTLNWEVPQDGAN